MTFSYLSSELFIRKNVLTLYEISNGLPNRMRKAYPKWTCNSILISHCAALEQSRSPCPSRDNTTRNQSGFDAPASCIEFLASLGRVLGVFVLQKLSDNIQPPRKRYGPGCKTRDTSPRQRRTQFPPRPRSLPPEGELAQHLNSSCRDLGQTLLTSARTVLLPCSRAHRHYIRIRAYRDFSCVKMQISDGLIWDLRTMSENALAKTSNNDVISRCDDENCILIPKIGIYSDSNTERRYFTNIIV